MLQIVIPGRPETEWWDPTKGENGEFVIIPGTKERALQLEHSLVSLAKWESKWCKPFLSKTPMTSEETIDYIRCMTITQNVPLEVYNNITNDIVEEVTNYINAPMTATWFADSKKGGGRSSGEMVTAEVIYYWMIALQIPSEYQKWHLNRLLTLIQVCSEKNKPSKKMSKRAIMNQNTALNAARRAQFNSKG